MTAGRILLVEDNPDDQVLVLRALKKNHIDSEVTVVDDGVEALEYLFGEGKYHGRSDDTLPTVMLLDIKLPRLDGHDVLRQLRADSRTRHLPVVVMTSSSEEEDIRKSYELGANSYIRKPVDSGQLTSTVTQLGNYWLKLNQSPYA
ncbi:MAG: response regulator [Pseudomonadota bacterium]|nr:response regulator [Pseudomonadota bacterium]